MSGIEVSNGAETTITAADFSYRFDGLAPGNYAITPSQVTHLVVPGTRTASVDTDVVDVDFTAYRWNSLSLEKSGQGLLKVSYAGTNAKAVVIQSTTTPPAWQDYSTNEVGADGLIQLQVPTVDTQRLFRVVVP